MQNNVQANNIRIARNTLYMYIRMLVLMIISLFTSRIILQALGVEDYGLYNVVYGMVLLFAFVNNAMATGTQRHLSYELGKERGDITKVFSACVHIHFVLALVIGVVAEVVGIWYLNTKMNIPVGRTWAANIVFQIAVANILLSIVRVPYDASVIAWERFSYYAYISILEGVLRMAVALMLYYVSFDKLIAFSILQFIAVAFVCATLIIYCHRKLSGVRLVRVMDKGQYKYLLSFSGWTLVGSAAVIGETQGLNLIANFFYGVTINASFGIANQVRSIVQQFALGFQTALNPQLVKAHAGIDKARQLDLIVKSSKLSFYILLLVTLPLMVNVDYALYLWLGDTIPPYTSQITNLCIVVALVEALSSPLYTTIFAVGKIKVYQVMVSLMRMISVVCALAVCYMNMLPYYVYVVPCFVAVVLLIYRIMFVHKEIGLDCRKYFFYVLLPIFKVIVITLAPILFYKHFFNSQESFIHVFLETAAIFLYIGGVFYLFGLTASEKTFIRSAISRNY